MLMEAVLQCPVGTYLEWLEFILRGLCLEEIILESAGSGLDDWGMLMEEVWLLLGGVAVLPVGVLHGGGD